MTHTTLSKLFELSPSLHIGALTPEARILLHSASREPDGYAVFCIDLTKCCDKSDLLSRIAAALHFPDWFGHNWDALADCLKDMSWHPATNYLIVLEHAADFQQSDAAQFCTLLELCREAIDVQAQAQAFMHIFIDLPA